MVCKKYSDFEDLSIRVCSKITKVDFYSNFTKEHCSKRLPFNHD